VVVFAVWRMSRSIMPRQPSISLISGAPALPPPAGLPGTYAASSAVAMPAVPVTAGTPGIAAPVAPIQGRRDEVRQRVSEIATEDPDTLAELIRGWMSDAPAATAPFAVGDF
jgi:hypothetical protein